MDYPSAAETQVNLSFFPRDSIPRFISCICIAVGRGMEGCLTLSTMQASGALFELLAGEYIVDL
jgi:hypothetical protein